MVDRVHTHDFHATILRLLGLDHEQLTYFHDGRDFRLTDVAGRWPRRLGLIFQPILGQKWIGQRRKTP